MLFWFHFYKYTLNLNFASGIVIFEWEAINITLQVPLNEIKTKNHSFFTIHPLTNT